MSTDPTKPTTEARSPNPGSAEWWASLPPAERERRLTAFHEAMKTIMGRWDHLDRSKDASNG